MTGPPRQPTSFPSASPAASGLASLWLGLSRPRFWLYLAGPYVVGYAAGAARREDFLRPEFWLWLLAFLLPANLLLYGVNDLCDRSTDIRNPRKGAGEHLLSDAELSAARQGVWASGLVLVALAAFAPSPVNVLMALFLVLSVAYSAPPARLKARPLLDSASNALYALPAFIGFHQASGRLPSPTVVAACCLWTAAMHLYSAIPDIRCDREAGLSTSATALGARGAATACLALWSAAVGLFVFRGLLWPWSLLGLAYPALALYSTVYPSSVPRLYGIFPLVNGGAGMLAFFAAGVRLWRP